MKPTNIVEILVKLEEKHRFLSCDMIHDQDALFEIQEALTEIMVRKANENQRIGKMLATRLPYLFERKPVKK